MRPYGLAGSADDVLSRVATIGDGCTTYASYRYLGAGTLIGENFVQAQVKLDYSADNFDALDRFGRVVDHVWISYGENPGVLDEYTYRYDPYGTVTPEGCLSLVTDLAGAGMGGAYNGVMAAVDAATQPEPPPIEYPPGYNGGVFPPGLFH